jgi:hypothetical protein
VQDQNDRCRYFRILLLRDVDKIGPIAAIDFDSPSMIAGAERFSGKRWHSDQAQQPKDAESQHDVFPKVKAASILPSAIGGW